MSSQTTPQSPSQKSALPCETMQSENFAKKLSACIHCGMCLPACPTYRITGSEAESPRGRIYLMNAFREGLLSTTEQLTKHLDLCLGCMACMTACPSGVDYETLLMDTRKDLAATQPATKRWVKRWLLKNLLPNPKLLKLATEAVLLSQKLKIPEFLEQTGLIKLLGPLAKQEQFTPTIDTVEPLKPGLVVGENRRGRVALFVGCIMNTVYHTIHHDTIAVLVENGYQVTIPEQTCCGALAYHGGESDIAQSLADENIKKLMQDERIDFIVINSAGCGATLKAYDHVSPKNPNSKAFSNKVVDIMELLAQHPLAGPLSPLNKRVVYHAACHLHHAQKVDEAPYRVLQQIPGVQLVPLTDASMCCGSAGVYNLAQPDMSLAILDEKMDAIEQTHPDVILAANPGCLLQLETGLRQRDIQASIQHPIELVAQAYQPRQI